MIRKTLAPVAASMGTTAFLLLSAAAIFGLLPFGNANFVMIDARIQYVDLFAWLQHVLHGEDSLTWSFFRGLGGNVWPIFTYYLSSPLNLLVLLFQREDLYLFYHLVTLWKLVLASGTMAVYLCLRFRHEIPAYAVVILSAAYAMSEYGVHQLINVMWLDGLYMLPLVLLGVWRAGTRQGSACLVISAACAMIFNWYTGCIDLLFAGFFALWEAWLACGDDFHWRAYGAFVGRVFIGILLGAGLSAVIFLPTIAGLSGGRASIDWNELSLRYHGNLPFLFLSQFWGAFSEKSRVALYVGLFAFFNAVACYWNASIPKRWRRRALVLPLFLALAFYWQPLYFLFSLLKTVDSYWYRASLIGIFLLIYLAGWNVSASKRWKNLPAKGHRLALVLVCFFSLADLWGNFAIYTTFRYTHDGADKAYTDYTRAQDAQMAVLRAQTAGEPPYRVNQTLTFNTDPMHLRANYDEGMASRAMMLAIYTSSPVNAQMKFLEDFGYRQGGPNMNIVNTTFLGTDSLLGVRYVIAERPFLGLQRVDGLPEATSGKAVYRNPFALPLAFVCDSFDLSGLPGGDPFLHTNAAYGVLFGRQMDVYRPVPFETVVTSDHEQHYQLSTGAPMSRRGGQLYGNIRGSKEDDKAYFSVDGGMKQDYFRWIAPSVFDITDTGSEGHDVMLASERPLPDLQAVQFYRTDEGVLQEAADLAWSRAADVTLGKDAAALHITAHAGEKLFTSLPWDKGWKAELNGREVRPECIADVLMGFTLDEGENEITLHYELPGWKTGAAVTLLALAASVLLFYRERKTCSKEGISE